MIKLFLCLFIYSILQHSFAQTQITIDEDFNDGNYIASPTWTGNINAFSIYNTTPISGSNTFTDGNYIGTNTQQGKVTLTIESIITDEWNISLATPDFSPSSMNYIGVILMSDVAIAGDINATVWNGYYLRIGDDTNDKICLYKRTGRTSTLIGEFNTPSFTSNGLKNGISLNIKRSGYNFLLAYKLAFLNETGSYIDAGSIYEDTYKSSNYFGIFQVINNVSNQRRIFADNILLTNYFSEYTWNGSINNDFNNALNWTPIKSYSFSSDKLEFKTGHAIDLTNVKSMHLKSLIITNNTQVRFKATPNISATIDIKNNFEIESGSKLILDIEGTNDNPITIRLNQGAKGTINGSIEFIDTYDHGLPTHRLLAEEEHAIIFNNGASFIATDLDDSPFGNTGINNTVEFMDGSTYYAYDGAAPFGKTQPDSKVLFNANSNYIHCSNLPPSLAGRTYGNLTIDYAGNIYYNNGSNSSNACSINNLYLKKGTIIIQLSSNKQKQNLYIQGNFTVDEGAAFKFIPTTSQAQSILRFNGTTEQIISGTGSIEFGKNATIEMANSNHIKLEKDLYIQGNLSFSNNARLLLNQYNITVDSLINNAGATQFIVTNSSYADNNGYLIRKIKQGNFQYLFPIGTSITDYTPCTIANNTGVEGHATIKVFDYLYEHGKYGNPLTEDFTVTKTWEINTLDALDVDIKLQWNQSNEGSLFNRSNSKMSKNKGLVTDDAWKIINTSLIGAIGTNPYTLEASGVSSFSKFGIASDDATLPIELLSFNGSYSNYTTMLNWVTATETNNDKFIIERSTDGINFENTGIVSGAGNSNSTSYYSFTDNSILEKTYYYRLMQIDYNGKSQTFPIIAVDCSFIQDNLHIKLFDMYGNLIYQGNQEPEDYSNFHIQKGIYILQTYKAGRCSIRKIFL